MNLSFAKALDRAVGGALCGLLRTSDRLVAWVRPDPAPIGRVRHLLVVKLWGLGNWALLRPLVRDLRDRWPGARLSIVTLEANAPLVADLADETLLVRPQGILRTVLDLGAAVRRLRRDPPEMSVDFEQFSTVGVLLARASGIPQRLGFRSGAHARDGLLTVRVPFRTDAHASRSFRDLAEAAGVAAGPYVAGGLAPSPAGIAEAEAFLAGDAASGPSDPQAPLVLLHPGSGDNFPGRRWSEAGFSAVGRQAIERHGARVVVTGGAGEAALASRVAVGAGAAARSAAGLLSVEGLVGLLARATVLVSNDTGPVHLASALGVPVLALFGPNTPVLYGPLSGGSRAFYRALPCSPCLTTESYRSSACRIHTCMASLSTGEVVAALDALLGARSSPVSARSSGGKAPATLGPSASPSGRPSEARERVRSQGAEGPRPAPPEVRP